MLGTLLFLLYVNDLPDYLQCNPKLFADDISLNEHMVSISASTIILKPDLNIIAGWAYQWKMYFNPEKTANEVVFSNRSHINPQTLKFVEKNDQSG